MKPGCSYGVLTRHGRNYKGFSQPAFSAISRLCSSLDCLRPNFVPETLPVRASRTSTRIQLPDKGPVGSRGMDPAPIGQIRAVGGLGYQSGVACRNGNSRLIWLGSFIFRK